MLSVPTKIKLYSSLVKAGMNMLVKEILVTRNSAGLQIQRSGGDLAGFLGITQRAYSKIENNEVQLKIERLEEIAKLLNTNASELLAKDNGQYFENVQNSQIGNNNTMNNFNHSSEELIKLIQQKEKEVWELRDVLKKRVNE